MENVYDQFPFREQQSEMAKQTFTRLGELINEYDATTKADTKEALGEDIDVSTVVNNTETDFIVSSNMHAFVPMFSDIHALLPALDQIPEYLMDSLRELLAQLDKPRLHITEQYDATIEHSWQQTEVERHLKAPFNIGPSAKLSDGTVRIEFRYDNLADTWCLGYKYTEARKYHATLGGRLYRIARNTLHSDPVGSREDELNAREGCYAPSRFGESVLKHFR